MKAANKMKETIQYIDKYQKIIEDLKTSINIRNSNEGKFCGKAFIVFNQQDEAEQILKKFYNNIIKRALSYILFKIWKWK